MDEGKDLYRVLQVDPEANESVIHAAFRALARMYHPDGDVPDNRLMSDINCAYAVLRDPEARRRHDIRRLAYTTRALSVDEPWPRAAASAPERRESSGPTVLDFGRYAGWSVAELARHDPDYLRWLCRHSSGLRFRDAISRVLPREPDLERRANSVA